MRKVLTSLAIGLASAGVTPGSAVPAQPTYQYQIAMDMSAGDQLISRPRLVTGAGEPAEFSIQPGNGASYRATITIDRLSDGKLHVSSAFAVVSVLTGAITATPNLIVLPNEKFTVEFGNSSAVYKPFRADLVISRIAP
jgi:hypothetical protein